MSPNDADGMANSVDPDQTAPLIRIYTVCPGITVPKLRIITSVNISYQNANQNTCGNYFKILTMLFYRWVLHTDADRITNSAEPHQKAPSEAVRAGSALFSLT